MSSRALALALLLVTTALAGCASTPQTSQSVTLSRQVQVHVDSAGLKAVSGTDPFDPYKFVTVAFVVHVGSAPVAASAMSIAYTDRLGNTGPKPLTAFTTAETLAPGAEVVVDDVNLTSDATLSLNGATVVTRARALEPWWTVQGYPIGVRMAPGAALSYAYGSDAVETYHLRDIVTTSDPTYKLDDLAATFGVRLAGTLDLAYDAASSSVDASKTQTARPLAWTTNGNLAVPMKLAATGSNTSSGQKFDAGFELLPASGVTFDANGKVWMNDSSSPVRADVNGGSARSLADAIAWETGISEATDSFSCAGKTRADMCRPAEMHLPDYTKTQPIVASKLNLDDHPWNVDPETLANVTRLLSEDLVPGDELRIDLDVDSRQVPGAAPDAPHVTFVATTLLRAVGYEKATVGAGAFDALKLVERLDVNFTIDQQMSGDKLVMAPVSISQRFVDTTFYLAKDTFVPLRFEHTTPLDLNAIVDRIVAAIPEQTWTDARVKPIRPDNVDVTLEAKTTMELKSLKGDVHFSPYAVIGAFHGASLFPLALAQSATGFGGAFPWMGTPLRASDMQIQPAPYPPPAPAYPYPTPYPTSSSYVSLAIASDGPATNDSKDYVVRSVSSNTPHARLGYALDGEPLALGPDAPGWCVAVNDTCDFDASNGLINAGDVIRIMHADVVGKTLTVTDLQSGATILSVVVR